MGPELERVSAKELREAHKAAGGYFFDRDVMSVYSTRLLPSSIYRTPQGIVFVTSETSSFMDIGAVPYPRRYTVHLWDERKPIVEIMGQFRQWDSARDAKEIARNFALSCAIEG